MRNIMVYPVSKKEIEDALVRSIIAEQASEAVGSIDLLCLQLALQIVQESKFKTYPVTPIEMA